MVLCLLAHESGDIAKMRYYKTFIVRVAASFPVDINSNGYRQLIAYGKCKQRRKLYKLY
jgi:hypothetical protein